ncbi:MAG: ATP-binding cassette domain-containing protein [Mycobacteriales bacterium]
MAVDARDLRVSLGGRVIFDNVSVEIPSGAEIALTGRSGSGKTTLLMVLAGLLPPAGGTVSWPGMGPDPTPRREQIGLVFQAPSLMPELTAAENIALPRRLQGASRRDAAAAAMDALAAVGLTGTEDVLPAELSGGQQQRVAVARVLAGRARLILADEPTGALDRHTARIVLAALRDHARRTNATLVVATHDEELAGMLPGRAVLADGAVSLQLEAPRTTAAGLLS